MKDYISCAVLGNHLSRGRKKGEIAEMGYGTLFFAEICYRQRAGHMYKENPPTENTTPCKRAKLFRQKQRIGFYRRNKTWQIRKAAG
jgi:hypothetical protein